MFDLKKQLEHTEKYAEAFWQHEMLDRPYISIRAPKRHHPFSFTPAQSYATCMSGDYAKAFNAMLEHIDSTYYGGEAIPVLEITLGPDQYAGILGAKIETSAESFTTWSSPFVDDICSYSVSIDRSEGSYYDKLLKAFKAGAEFAKGKFLLNTLDLHSGIDALAAIRGPLEFCYDVMDEPEEVLRVMNELRATYEEIYNIAYVGGKMKDIGTTGWIPAYCKGRSAVVQSDFSCMLSAEQGRKFVFPAVEEEAASHDHCIYHLDGKESLVHLDTILSIKEIDCIEWVPGAGNPKSFEWMDLLHKIQAAGKSVWIDDWSLEEFKLYHKELQPDKVGYMLWAPDPDSADEALELVTKNT